MLINSVAKVSASINENMKIFLRKRTIFGQLARGEERRNFHVTAIPIYYLYKIT